MKPPKKKPKMDQGFKEDPFVLLPSTDPVWLAIKYVHCTMLHCLWSFIALLCPKVYLYCTHVMFALYIAVISRKVYFSMSC